MDGILGNKLAVYAVIVVIIVQLLFTYTVPMQRLFGSAALPPPGLAANYPYCLFRLYTRGMRKGAFPALGKQKAAAASAADRADNSAMKNYVHSGRI